jgi:hypothetical protein
VDTIDQLVGILGLDDQMAALRNPLAKTADDPLGKIELVKYVCLPALQVRIELHHELGNRGKLIYPDEATAQLAAFDAMEKMKERDCKRAESAAMNE